MSTSFSLDLARAVMDARTTDIATTVQARSVVLRRRRRRAESAAYRSRLRLLQA